MVMVIPKWTSIISALQLPTGNYTRHDISFGKYFKAINTFGRQVLHAVFIVIYSTLETSNGSLTVKAYCQQKLKWSNAQYRNAFSAAEREILKNDPKGPNFTCDVTLLFKLIIKILGNMADPFMQELRDLKNLRNTVCHEDIEMNEANLRCRFDTLEILCCKILYGLGSVTGEDITSYEQELKGGLQDLFLARIEISDIQSYMEDVDNFRQQKHSKLIIHGRQELIGVYSKIRILNPCSWLSDHRFNEFSVDKIFTTLVIVNDGTHILMRDILNVTVMKTRFVPRLIIVSGVMGAGKTSLHRYLLDEWCRRSPTITGLSSMDIVIGIELRTVSCRSLVQYLREQLLRSTSRLFNESDIIPLLQEMNVLFAIDGMDEAGLHGKMIVKEIVNKFTNSRIIITTRPEFILELMQLAEDHVILQIEGFDDQGKIQFVNNVFAAKYTDAQSREIETKRFLDFLFTTCRKISNHLTLPLTLALLLVLWCDDTVEVTSITTLTHLYYRIYDMCQRKLVSRLRAAGAGHAVSLSRKVQRWLLELGCVAWDMIQKDVLDISEAQSKHLMNMCDKEGIDPIQTMSAFLNCEVKETIVDTKYLFSFHHTSGLEFLAAMYIKERVVKNKSLGDISKAIDSPRYRELMMYVTGLLKISGNLNTTLASQVKNCFVCDMEVHPSDYSTWWKLLREAENDSSMSMVLGSIVNQADVWIVDSRDTGEETQAKLNLLRETGASPSELIMQIHYTTPLSRCKELQDILRLVGEGQRSIVKLYLEKEFNSAGHQEINDNHVVPLLKFNRMVEFKGHVGEDFMSVLAEATRVESLFIRVSTLGALNKLSASVRKHRRWKVKLMPSRRWMLKYIELFLDLSTDVTPDDVPRLHYNKNFVVKLADITDKKALWAGEVLKTLNHNYTSIIFQSSSLTISGIKELLQAASDVKIKNIRVFSDHPATADQIAYITRKYHVRIGWGSS